MPFTGSNTGTSSSTLCHYYHYACAPSGPTWASASASEYSSCSSSSSSSSPSPCPSSKKSHPSSPSPSLPPLSFRQPARTYSSGSHGGSSGSSHLVDSKRDKEPNLDTALRGPRGEDKDEVGMEVRLKYEERLQERGAAAEAAATPRSEFKQVSECPFDRGFSVNSDLSGGNDDSSSQCPSQKQSPGLGPSWDDLFGSGSQDCQEDQSDSALDSDIESKGSTGSKGSKGSKGRGKATQPRLSRAWSRMADEGARAAERARTEGTGMPQRLADGTFVPARYWGMSRQQVKLLYEAASRDSRWRADMSVRDFVDVFIKPCTAGTGRGVSLHFNGSCPLQVTLMVSHAWIENASEFFEDFLGNTEDHEVAFICFLSNYQGTLEEVNDQLGNEIHSSPFTQVLRSDRCERMLVVPNEALRESGEGLYSRLWCDWEMKVAADAGIPIHIPTKNSWEHLLGHKTGSSKQARCGQTHLPMNRDETLIRKAVESMPPDTAKSVALAICIETTCAIFSPSIATKVIGDSIFVWLVGVPIGICLGLFLAWWITRCLRPSRRDGYKVLDRLIRGAAQGWYSTRRFRVRDLISLSIFVHSCGFAYVLFKRFVFKQSWSCAADGHMDAVTIAIPVWGIAHVNKLGPWIGFFTPSRTEKCLVAGLQLCCSIVGGLIDVAIQANWDAGALERSQIVVAFGRGWFLGWFFSWNCLSCSARKWLHLTINLVVFIVITFVRHFQGGNLYLTVFVLLMGINAVLVRPEWSVRERGWIFLFLIVAIIGFLWLVLQDAATGLFGSGFCVKEDTNEATASSRELPLDRR